MGTNTPGRDAEIQKEISNLLTLARKLEAHSTWLEGEMRDQVILEAKYLREDWELENLESDSWSLVSGPII